jgi:tetratricopeptide (TPR) repeat protein
LIWPAQQYADKALPLAKRATEASPYSPAVHEALGDAYLGLGRYHQAGLSYNTVSGLLPPRRPVVLRKMARSSSSAR